MSNLREAAQQALEVLEDARRHNYALKHKETDSLVTTLRAALAQQKRENQMPITNDNGQAIKPQYRVIKAAGNWQLLYDQMRVGDAVRHEFRITKMTHDIALFPGITLEEAIKRFDERVEAANRE